MSTHKWPADNWSPAGGDASNSTPLVVTSLVDDGGNWLVDDGGDFTIGDCIENIELVNDRSLELFTVPTGVASFGEVATFVSVYDALIDDCAPTRGSPVGGDVPELT